MTPNAGKDLQLSDPRSHILDLNLRVLRRKVQISLRRQHQRLRLDPLHGLLEVAIVGLLLRDIARLPCMRHYLSKVSSV
jgi:hypothetical protein